MLQWIRDLDRVLRGHATSPAALADGELRVPVDGLAVLVVVLGLVYGLCMSVFTLSVGGPHALLQTASCMAKTPAVFLLTLAVTFPSLYVFNAMLGSRLTAAAMLRLLVATLAVLLAVLASIGPIVAFFSLTTTSYPFMVLLNVAVGGLAGLLAMRFLLQTLHRLVNVATVIALADDGATAVPVGPLDRSADHPLGRHVRVTFQVWVLLFAVVGTQMAWVLSPFLGHATGPFVFLRPTGSNFFQGVIDNLNRLVR